MTNSELYKSVLSKLSQIPVDHLQLVDNYLASLQIDLEDIKTKRNATLALAGSWTDMSQNDFEDFLQISKETGTQLFNRDVDL